MVYLEKRLPTTETLIWSSRQKRGPRVRSQLSLHSGGVYGSLLSCPVLMAEPALGLGSEVCSGLLGQRTLSFQLGWEVGRRERGSWILGELNIADWSLEPQESR